MSETVTINYLTVAVERPATPAARPPLLFVHGMMGGAWYWANYQRFFAARGYTSYALNLRGHHDSRSMSDLGAVRMSEYVDDALGVARSLGEPPVVIGHSMGGLIAQKLAEEGAVRAAVLLCSAPPRGIPVFTRTAVLRQLKYLPSLLRSRPLVGTRADNDALTFNRVPAAERAALHERFVAESGSVGREMLFGTVAVDAARVRCPVLSVSASDDRMVAPAIGRRIAEKYGAVHLVFDGHAHFLIWEPGWEGPAGYVEKWISDVTAVRDVRAS